MSDTSSSVYYACVCVNVRMEIGLRAVEGMPLLYITAHTPLENRVFSASLLYIPGNCRNKIINVCVCV